MKLRYNHIGIPTIGRFDGEIGVLVAMIEVKGAPVELMQIDRSIRKDL